VRVRTLDVTPILGAVRLVVKNSREVRSAENGRHIPPQAVAKGVFFLVARLRARFLSGVHQVSEYQ
jgi:hypothetical protein